MYRDPLPSRRTLKHLGELIGPFPIRRRHISLEAERYAFSPRVIEFLLLFPPEELFRTRVDFIGRCEELKMLMNVEHRVSLGVSSDAHEGPPGMRLPIERAAGRQHFFDLIRRQV